MEQLVTYDAILFPSDGRPPTVVPMVTSPMSNNYSNGSTNTPSRMPHPEVHMDYVPEGLGSRSWRFILVEALEGMKGKFTNPYIIFYPIISRDGMPFPINKTIRDIQGTFFKEQNAWRGNIVAAKYHDNPFASMIDASMADFPLLKNYLSNHAAPKY